MLRAVEMKKLMEERQPSGEASAYLAAIVESSDDAIISKNFDGIIQSWNKSAERIFGYSAAEAIGKHITLIIPPDRHNEEKEIISQIKAGKRIQHYETVRCRKDGSFVNLSITVSPVRDPSGKIIGASKVARDITERKRIEKALWEQKKKAESASRAKSDFLATMSHEIRTPMNAIIGLSNILSMSKPLSDKQREYIKVLQSSANSLLLLINDLLDISKIEAQSIELEESPFSLAQIVEDVVGMMKLRAREKKIDLNFDVDSVKNYKFIGDPARIRQVLINLCSNALKFTEKGSVSVKVQSHLSRTKDIFDVSIIVQDTGIGIPEVKLDTIFEKFVQADTSISRKYGGTGLGLSITKKLVEIMGGSILVESAVGVGSSFKVLLPLRVAYGEMLADKPLNPLIENISPSPRGKGKILLVEDHEPNIMVAGTFLESLEYTYDIARTGAEAMKKIRSRDYDVVLMDVQMPEMNGFEATQLIRKQEREENRHRVPIIGITAHAMAGDRERCLQAGMDEYISKPFTAADLQDKLEKVIEA